MRKFLGLAAVFASGAIACFVWEWLVVGLHSYDDPVLRAVPVKWVGDTKIEWTSNYLSYAYSLSDVISKRQYFLLVMMPKRDNVRNSDFEAVDYTFEFPCGGGVKPIIIRTSDLVDKGVSPYVKLVELGNSPFGSWNDFTSMREISLNYVGETLRKGANR